MMVEVLPSLLVRLLVEQLMEANNAGGLIGYLGSGSSISDCYASASATGTGGNAGGLIGGSGGTITSCYATGAVDGGGHW